MNPPRKRRQAAILLEVVLALTLLFTAGGVIVGSISSSLSALRYVKLEAQGSDLAVTLISLVQMGQIPVQDAAPQGFQDESLAGWTWQIATSPFGGVANDVQLTRVEIVVANASAGYTCRLTQLFPPAQDLTLESSPAGQGATEDQP